MTDLDDLNSEAGFTLVELLVALTLFSLLSMTLISNLDFGIRAWQRSFGQADRIDETMHAQSLLRHMIEQTQLYFLVDTVTTKRVDFTGAPTSMAFLAPLPMAAGTGGRSRLKLFVDRAQNHADLVLESIPELAAANATPTATRLMSDIDTVTLTYFGGAHSDRAVQWHDRWSDEPALPQLIRIQIAFADRDARKWPDFVVAPRIAVDVGCVYDQLAKACRGR